MNRPSRYSHKLTWIDYVDDLEERLKKATDVLGDILHLPEMKKSREVLDGELVSEIVKHALERQYTLGAIEALSEEFWSAESEMDEYEYDDDDD